MQIGSGDTIREEDALYSSGILTNTLTFRYHIRENDLDTDGISVPESEGFPGRATVLIPISFIEANNHVPELEAQSGHKIDGRLPFVESASFISMPASGGVYRGGETIEVSLTFDKEVEVQDEPTIRLELGEGDSRRDAAYDRGSGTATLVFAYTVQATDSDADGVALTERHAAGFDGTGDIYEEATTNKVKGRIPGIDSQEGHAVLGQFYITSVSVHSEPGDDGAYGVGDPVEILVGFDTEVTVTGVPQLKFDLNGEDRTAAFQTALANSEDAEPGTSHSSDAEATGEALVFTYIVRQGDEDTDGIAIGEDAISLNGGTIVTATGDEPDLSHTLVDDDRHVVDGVLPTLSSAQTSSDGYFVIFSFSENVHVPPAFRTLSAFMGGDVGVLFQAVIDIFVDGYRGHTTGATVTNTNLSIKMDTPISAGQPVTVSYDNIFAADVAGLLEDEAGNPLVEFADETVTNNSTWSSDEHPQHDCAGRWDRHL